MYSGIFPDELKIAKVIPLFKSGKRHDLSNYRPISILPLFSKIFEKLIHVRLTSFFDTNNVLSENQFGFRRKHSTVHALNTAISSITKSMNDKSYSIGLFIDFSKAFDTIKHDILLSKLEHYGIRGPALDLLTDYLTNRFQYVTLDARRCMLGSPPHLYRGASGVSSWALIIYPLYKRHLQLCL